MNTRWAIFALCILLVAGSGVGALAAAGQHAAAVRGWENATASLNLPYRVPLAGVNVDLLQYTPEDLNRELDRIAAAGFTWVRQFFLWQIIEPQQGVYEWDAYDRLVAAVAAHDSLQLVAVLDGTPPWARHVLAPDHPYAPPASVSDYGSFAGAVAARYEASITYYQIWDEPNLKLHWGNLDPRPAHYVAMLRTAYTAIHAADPDAVVIAAALAPTVETGPDNLSDLLFLRAMYEQGAQGYFEAAAAKPYGFDLGPYDRTVDEGVLNYSRWILLREEMVRRGDGTKALWGSYFGWNHLPDDWTGPPSIWGRVSAEERAAYTRDAYRRAREEWPWTGGLILQHWEPDAPPDDPIQGFAVSPAVEQWLEQGVLPAPDGLPPGLHPATNGYTTYSDNWQLSDLGADAVIPDPQNVTPDQENRITVRFEGTAFAMPVRRDDYMAYLYVTVDGEPANALPKNRAGEAFILLTSPGRKPEMGMIAVARDLPEGAHVAEIVQRPYNGDDRWPIAGYAVGSPADETGYERALLVCGVLGGLALLGAVVIGSRLPWGRVRAPSPRTLRQVGQWLVSLSASWVVAAGALLTWGEALPVLLRRDPPTLAITILTAGIASLSPVSVVTLAALVVLFVLIYNRPVLGLMLIIFWSAFFLSTLDLLFRLFATVEVYLVMTVAAVAGREIVAWARGHREGVRASQKRLRLTRLDWAVLFFVMVGVISLAWVEYRGTAARELRIIILEPAVFYALLRLLRLERRDVLWLVDAILFTGGAIAVVGLVLFATGESVVEAEEGARRLISVYGSPNGVGLYLGRCLPFAFAFTVLPVGAWRRVLAASSGAVMLLAVLLSQSRGAILLGLPAALVIMILLWQGRRSLVPVGLTVVGIVVALIPLSMALPRLADVFGDTAFFRKSLWYSSLQLIQERPLTGVGLDQFLYWYRSRYLLPEAWAEPNLSIPHNILLNHWVSLGVLGILAAVLLQGLFWRGAWWAYRRAYLTDRLALALVIALAGSMAHFLAHGLVDVAYFSINLAFFFMLSLAMLERVHTWLNPDDA